MQRCDADGLIRSQRSWHRMQQECEDFILTYGVEDSMRLSYYLCPRHLCAFYATRLFYRDSKLIYCLSTYWKAQVQCSIGRRSHTTYLLCILHASAIKSFPVPRSIGAYLFSHRSMRSPYLRHAAASLPSHGVIGNLARTKMIRLAIPRLVGCTDARLAAVSPTLLGP